MNQKQKEKFGEWLMDIAKYMLTAMVLASMLEYMKEPAIMVSVYSMATILTLAVLVAIAVWGVGNRQDTRPQENAGEDLLNKPFPGGVCTRILLFP